MWNDPNQTTPSPSEPLPQELQDLDRSILADAADWASRVAAPERFTHRMWNSLARDRADGTAVGAVEESMSDPEERKPDASAPWTPSPHGDRSHSSKVRLPLAAVAAVLVVALLGGVFVTLGQNRAKVGGETATVTTTTEATPSATATATITKHTLQEGTPITGVLGTPIVAPSDPQIMYEYADNTDVVVRPSDNGGATWGKFLLPNFTGFVSAIELAVNPADAKNVFLRLTLGYLPGQSRPCSSAPGASSGSLGGSGTLKLNASLPASGGSICTDMYASQDGGANWSLVRLPVAGSLFQDGVTFTYDATIFQNQGTSLYGRVWQFDSSGSRNGDIRIVRSNDEGQSWSDADASLHGQIAHICAFSAAATGTALFAIASTATCWSGTSGTRSVWRSDDGGGHWARAGDLPAEVAQSGIALVAASASASSPALLYALPQGAGITKLTQIQASTDGGATWLPAPSAGLPSGAVPFIASLTPLSDGSLVAVVSTVTLPSGQGGSAVDTVSAYAWNPGAGAWNRLTATATLSGSFIANVYVSTVQPLVVTLSITDLQSTNPTYTLVPFA